VTYPERIVPEQTEPGIVALHLKRYEFARSRSRNTTVLDAGCGVGYGSAFLAERAQRVVGVDRSAEAIRHARVRYAAHNVEFVEANLVALPFEDESFDVVCAFETIEHLEDQPAFLRECARVLRPAGTLFVSTPRVERTTCAPANPFHRTELSPGDLERLLRGHFADVELYGQRRLQTRRHRLAQRLDVLGLRRRLPRPGLLSRLLGTAPTAEVGLDGIVIEPGALERATEVLAVCTGPGGR
jgi:SAM-dependent methyltransferase